MSDFIRGTPLDAVETLDVFVLCVVDPGVSNDADSFRAHVAGYTHPSHAEVQLVNLLQDWASYAARYYHATHGSLIGDDSVLAPHWAAIGQALLGMLDSYLGRLDAALLDRAIRAVAASQGCSLS